MGSNEDTISPKALEERGIGHNDDEPMLMQKNIDDDQLDLHASIRPENEKISSYPEHNKSKNEQSDAGFSQRRDNHKTDSSIDDKECLDEQHYRKSVLHQSPLSGISQRVDSSVSPSPGTRRGLDHCITAPAGSRNSMLLESQEKVISRSMTDQRDTARLDMKLDRLSEIEKRNLIVNLVKIQNDGTVEVDLSNNTTVASELLKLQSADGPPSIIDSISTRFNKSVPKLKIVMLVVGTRGDIQPFVPIAKRLQEFGHHVRLATHVHFSTFVKSAGVDFYPLAGDPRILAGYMARNKGFFPSSPRGISAQRKHLKTIIESVLPACTGADIETGQPFRAQAIIANPPAYGHVHVAESLGVPIHIFFTLPWTPTHEFPHPLTRVPQSAGNWLSYSVVDLIIWWTIRGYINDFRRRKLKLPPIAYFSLYHGSLSHLPTAYMWSPHLVPKPSDWGPLVDVVGYCFLNLGSKYQSPEEFARWMQNGTQPIYIGFGSMPLEDPRKTTTIILEALNNTGQRGIIDKGWGDLGTQIAIPDSVFCLADCPHDWLFPQCAAVVHHGGAGTTATGLRAGCPTTIVPFFGDQFFWGDKIHQKGIGPAPIPFAQLSVEALSDAIRFMLQPEVKSRAMELAKLIENEDGVAAAVDAFHCHLPSELPLPTMSSLSQEEDDHPNPLQWVFIQIGKLCSRPCGN